MARLALPGRFRRRIHHTWAVRARAGHLSPGFPAHAPPSPAQSEESRTGGRPHRAQPRQGGGVPCVSPSRHTHLPPAHLQENTHAYPHMHTCTCTHIHKTHALHTNTHAHVHTPHTHIHIQTCTRALMAMHIGPYSCTCAYICTHVYTYAPCAHWCAHMYTCMQCAHGPAHTCTRGDTHAHTHFCDASYSKSSLETAHIAPPAAAAHGALAADLVQGAWKCPALVPSQHQARGPSSEPPAT